MGDKPLLKLSELIYNAALDPGVCAVMLNWLADSLSAMCAEIGSYNGH
jgi:hypothetical protein